MNQRAEDARHRIELSESHARAEALQAQRLIDDFVAQCRERNILPEPLRAQVIGGREVRTDRTGWYIRVNRSVAIGEGGEFYLLTVAASRLSWLRGVHLEPSLPTLVINRGGRDGDAGDLADFLAARLALG